MKMIHSFFYSVGTKLISLVIILIARILTARILGPSDLGSLGNALNFTTVVSRWGSLGIAPAIQFTSSKYPDNRTTLLVYAVAVSIVVGLLNLLLLIYFNSEIIDWQFSTDSNGRFAYSKFLPCIPLVTLSMSLPIFLLGSGQIRKYSLTQVLPLLFQTFIIASALSEKESLKTVIIAQVANWVFTIIIALVAIDYKSCKFKFDGDLLYSFIKYAFSAWPQIILQFGISRFAVLIGSQYLSPKDLGYYILASNVSESLLLITTSVSPLIFNRIASQGTNIELLEQTIRVTNTLMLIAMLIIIFFGKSLFIFFFGVEFDQSWKLLLLLIWAVLFQGIIRICVNYIAASGKNVAVSGILLAQMTVLFVSGVIACPKFGTAGLCYATITASIVGFIASISRLQKSDSEPGLKTFNVLLVGESDLLGIYQSLRKIRNI